MEIYQPSDDSYFFASFLESYIKKHKPNSYLDLGTGSGILAKTASRFIDKKNILATDINFSAVKKLSKKLNTIQSDLFSNIKQKFDLITFNAPYLPEDKNEPVSSRTATTGGKKGDEISVKFLKQAKKHLNKNGKILLLISSLTPQSKIKKFKPKILAEKNLFMEKLLILEFT